MVNLDDVVNCLLPVVGFRSTQNNCLIPLDASLTGTTSGYNVMDEAGITQDVLEAAKDDSYNSLSDYLIDLRKGAIREGMQKFISQHKDLTRARTLLDNIDIVKTLNYFDLKDQNLGKFVGFEILPWSPDNTSFTLNYEMNGRGDYISAIIRQIGWQFDSTQNLTLYLFESTQQAPIATFTLNCTTTNSLQWAQNINQAVKYKNPSGGTAAKYYLGYFQSDLVGQSIQTRLYQNCGFLCGNAWVGEYQQYVMIRGIEIQPGMLNGKNLPNMRGVGYSDLTYGLHLRLSITCDITDSICDNSLLFASIIKKEIAKRLLWDIFNSDRINRKLATSKNQALVNIKRLEDELTSEYKSIKLDFTDIDKKCMPCNKKFITSATLR